MFCRCISPTPPPVLKHTRIRGAYLTFNQTCRDVSPSSIAVPAASSGPLLLWLPLLYLLCFSGGAHTNPTQGGCENSKSRQDPSLGHGRQGQARDQYSQALPTSAHREAPRDHRHAQRHLHGHGERGPKLAISKKENTVRGMRVYRCRECFSSAY